MASGLTIEEAAFCVYHSRSTFVRWLKNTDHPDHLPMPPECAEWFAMLYRLYCDDEWLAILYRLHCGKGFVMLFGLYWDNG